MVLGSSSRQSAGHNIRRRKSQLAFEDHSTTLRRNRMSDVECRPDSLLWAPEVLPPSAWPYSILLCFLISEEDTYCSSHSYPPQTNR